MADKKPRKVTNNRSNESGPCWSPDGRRLIVTSDSRGGPQLYEVSLSTGRLARISTNISSHCTEAAGIRLILPGSLLPPQLGRISNLRIQFAARKTKILTKGSTHAMQPARQVMEGIFILLKEPRRTDETYDFDSEFEKLSLSVCTIRLLAIVHKQVFFFDSKII